MILLGACAQHQDLGGGCFPGANVCQEQCSDPISDPGNCGGCGIVCATGQVCSSGQCSVQGCANGLTNCSGACVDVNQDIRHCGSCGNACPAGFNCGNLTCYACPPGTTYCRKSASIAECVQGQCA
jgi:hypothetical protein